MKAIILSISIIAISGSLIENSLGHYTPSKVEIEHAKDLAVDVARWFDYSTGKINSQHEGQCGDYALRFALKFNAYKNQNVARLVVANNPIPSGTYIIGDLVDVAELGFKGFSSGTSGFLVWRGEFYLYHPVIGAYQIFLEREWTPKKHFGVDMSDKRQVHVWASIGDLSVDPTYYDLWPEYFPSPIGRDE